MLVSYSCSPTNKQGDKVLGLELKTRPRPRAHTHPVSIGGRTGSHV